MYQMIRVMLANAEPLTSLAIRTLLTTEQGFVFLDGAATVNETIRCCKESKPDILLLATSTNEHSLTETITYLHQNYPDLKIMIVADRYYGVPMWKLISDGVVGYIMKDELPQGILLALRSVASGATWFSKKVLEDFVHEELNTINTVELTHREQEVLDRLTQDLSNKEIAFMLQITEKTVEFHVSNILRKLNVSSRTGAALWAKEKRFQQNIGNDNL